MKRFYKLSGGLVGFVLFIFLTAIAFLSSIVFYIDRD